MKKVKYIFTLVFFYVAWKAFFSTDIAQSALKKVVSPRTEISVSSPEYLDQVANSLNEMAGQMADKDTRIIGVDAKNGILTYHYELVNLSYKLVNTSEFNKQIKPIVSQSACKNKDMSYLLSNGVTIVYSYRGNDGVHMGAASITQYDC